MGTGAFANLCICLLHTLAPKPVLQVIFSALFFLHHVRGCAGPRTASGSVRCEALEKSGILGADCTYERMAILMSFVTPQAWGEVDSSELTKFMELWTATQMQAAEWEEWFEEHGQTQDLRVCLDPIP